MTKRLSAIFGALLLAPMSTSTYAAGDPNAARGIVADHCVACHEVPGYTPRHGKASVNAPPFQSIADRPSVYTAERLHRFLGRPHFPMTKFNLSPSDVDNLVAFIESLRKK